MKKGVVLLALLFLYGALLLPFSHHMCQRPFLEKVGYVPHPAIIEAITADQKNSVAAGLILKTMIYFGTLVEKELLGSGPAPDHATMHANLLTASRLDPYNMDTYYFAQAMSWGERQVAETTSLLEYGMRYRDWDFYLPFFAGFNYAFFLKDYEKAARHFVAAQQLSGADLFGRLASRYMYEAGETELAIDYLTVMIKGSSNGAVRQAFELRQAALQQVRIIELARDRFRERSGRLPSSVQELYRHHMLSELPVDPYGGEFYLDSAGAVRSTSQFASGSGKKQ